MNNIIQKLKNIWAIEDLRTRILNTVLFLTVYVAGTQILLPGIDSDVLQDAVNKRSGSDWTDLINQFSGGAFSNASIFALGIMPYITASIVIQLLGMAVPQFQKLQKEGESGRKNANVHEVSYDCCNRCSSSILFKTLCWFKRSNCTRKYIVLCDLCSHNGFCNPILDVVR